MLFVPSHFGYRIRLLNEQMYIKRVSKYEVCKWLFILAYLMLAALSAYELWLTIVLSFNLSSNWAVAAQSPMDKSSISVLASEIRWSMCYYGQLLSANLVFNLLVLANYRMDNFRNRLVAAFIYNLAAIFGTLMIVNIVISFLFPLVGMSK